jgi:hypothetical protein
VTDHLTANLAGISQVSGSPRIPGDEFAAITQVADVGGAAGSAELAGALTNFATGWSDIEAFGEHSEKGPLTMAAMRELLEQPDELSYGVAELTEAEVPAFGVPAEDKGAPGVAPEGDQAAQFAGRAAVVQQFRVVDHDHAGATERGKGSGEFGFAQIRPVEHPHRLLEDPDDHIRRVERRPYLSDIPACAVLMILSTSAGWSATWKSSSSSGPMLPSASIVSLSQPSRPFQ